MSSRERRKQRKARKDRLQVKKQAQHFDPWREEQSRYLAEVGPSLRDLVTSCKLRIAVTTTIQLPTLLAAMWEHDGVQVRAYDVGDLTSLQALAAAGEGACGSREMGAFHSRPSQENTRN
jgi:hypothetical protein